MNSICFKKFDISKPGVFVSTYAQMLNAQKLTSRKALISTTQRLMHALKVAEHNLFLVSQQKALSIMDWFKKKRMISALSYKVKVKRELLLDWVNKSISFFSEGFAI